MEEGGPRAFGSDFLIVFNEKSLMKTEEGGPGALGSDFLIVFNKKSLMKRIGLETLRISLDIPTNF